MRKWILHDLSHIVIPFIVSGVALAYNESLKPLHVFLVSLAGTLLPDIDHLNIWKEYKFKSFTRFFKFCVTSDRLRLSFLVFHNFWTIVILIALIPIASVANAMAGVFLLSFLCHLFLDFFDDKITIGRSTQWLWRRKT
jgi:hypothetical protein